MGNLYVFGCSFSFGSHINQIGYNKHSFFYQDQFTHYWWGHQVANYLNLIPRNYAIGGGSNDTAMYRAVRESVNFNEDDVVMLGRTQGDRVSLEAYRYEQYPKGGTDLNRGISRRWVDFEQKTDKFLKHFAEQLSSYNEEVKPDELELLFTNHTVWYAPDEKTEIYNKFFEKQFQWFGNLIARTGAKVIIWDNSIWDKFETITEWLRNRKNINERQKDSHWSPNGNTGFAAYVIDAIERDEFYINEFHVKTRKEEIYSKYLPKLLPYVDSNFEVKVKE